MRHGLHGHGQARHGAPRVAEEWRDGRVERRARRVAALDLPHVDEDLRRSTELDACRGTPAEASRARCRPCGPPSGTPRRACVGSFASAARTGGGSACLTQASTRAAACVARLGTRGPSSVRARRPPAPGGTAFCGFGFAKPPTEVMERPPAAASLRGSNMAAVLFVLCVGESAAAAQPFLNLEAVPERAPRAPNSTIGQKSSRARC